MLNAWHYFHWGHDDVIYALVRTTRVVAWRLACAHAASAPPDVGPLVVLPSYGEVRQANDEACLTWVLEERDVDKSAAASRVNRKMKEGIEIIRREDSEAVLKTRGYYTYAVYPAEQPRQDNGKPRTPTERRIGHYLDVTTKNLAVLSRTAAAAQQILSLNGLQFRVSEAAMKNLEEKRTEAVYRNLMRRIAAYCGVLRR